MSKVTTEKLQDEYESMRARLQHLQVQGNLGKRELRDKLQELGDALEPAYQRTKGTLAELSKSGAAETKRLAKSLQAGWAELRETHRKLSKGAEEGAQKERPRS